MKAKTIVYIDGFNFYYGCVKGTRLKWLNFSKFCQLTLPRHEIVEIKYFTARVRPRPDDPGVADRQRTFLRALETLPNFSIYYGHFIDKKVRMRFVDPPPGGPTTVLVHQAEEKGSDVNLASHLLIDGFRNRYECAVVVSNDGDLKHPVEVVRHELELPVGVLNPHERRSWALSPHDLPAGSFYKPIRRGPLEASQFPTSMKDERGSFRKPVEW